MGYSAMLSDDMYIWLKMSKRSNASLHSPHLTHATAFGPIIVIISHDSEPYDRLVTIVDILVVKSPYRTKTHNRVHKGGDFGVAVAAPWVSFPLRRSLVTHRQFCLVNLRLRCLHDTVPGSCRALEIVLRRILKKDPSIAKIRMPSMDAPWEVVGRAKSVESYSKGHAGPP